MITMSNAPPAWQARSAPGGRLAGNEPCTGPGPAQRLELVFQAYQFALDAVRTTEKQRRAGGTGLARHAANAGGSEAGQVKTMEQMIQWGELDLDLIRRRARAAGVIEQFERLLPAAWEEIEE